MNWYPQLRSGATAQFPVVRKRAWRVIANNLESGERIYASDLAAGHIEWELQYQDLSDLEVSDLVGFFKEMGGAFGTFGFADPLANLLCYSEMPNNSVWTTGTMVISPGVIGTTGQGNAWSVSNPSSGSQEFSQTISVPVSLNACFSVYLRSTSGGAVSLRRDASSIPVQPNSNWRRFWIARNGIGDIVTSTFGVIVPAGGTVEVCQPQVEAQPYPGQYVKSSWPGGVYPQTYFMQDELTVVRTAPGRSSCKVKLLSRV